MRRTSVIARVGAAVASVVVTASLAITVAYAQETAAAGAQLPAATTTLEPPQSLTATAVCVAKKPQIVVSWNASPSTFVSSYVVVRSLGATAPTTLGTQASSDLNYLDTAVQLNKTYIYGVTSSYLLWASTTPTATATTAKKC